MSAPLDGVLAEAVTPRRSQEYSIDLGATLELVDFLGASGVQGIVLLGSTGEFVHFALDDRRHMLAFAAKRSRLPLLVNVSHSTLDGAIGLAREAERAGVAGVLLMPPYYFGYGQQAIRSFYLAFAAAVGKTLPIYLHNLPAFASEIGPATATELLATGQFAGIQDSGDSVEYFRGLTGRSSKSAFTLLAGCERTLVAAKSMGAHAVVSAVASAAPELMVALVEAVAAGARDRVRILEARVLEFLDRVEIFPSPVGIKEALRMRNMNVGALAVPLGEDGDRKLEEFQMWFRSWLPEVLRECGK
jgi:dihydrodipicolinate synthase/N-acetylneuraminate lyase